MEVKFLADNDIKSEKLIKDIIGEFNNKKILFLTATNSIKKVRSEHFNSVQFNY